MRIVPVAYSFTTGINNTKIKQTQFERNDTAYQKSRPHQYTGVASYDLAYASMFDNEIAKDLKLMGLI